MIAVCLLMLALAAPTFQQNTNTPKSPCPNVFMYQPSTVPGKWLGVIYLSTDTILYSLWLNIVLDSKAIVLGSWLGSVTTDDNLNFFVLNKDMKINPGPAESFYFYVEYNPAGETPRVQAIRLNGREICNANTQFDNFDNLWPQTTSRSSEPSTRRPQVNSEHIPSPKPGQGQQSEEGRPEDMSPAIQQQTQCGKVSLNRSKRTINGTTTLEGQWPWHVAIYWTQSQNSKYFCGGTLLSHRHVITAGICVVSRLSDKVPNINILSVHLGKNHLETFTEGAQIRYLEKVTLHPDNNLNLFRNNLAIITMKEPVSYSDWVQPACLWPEDQMSLSDVIGKKGSVVGWGYDGSGRETKNLKLVELTVVDHESCIESDVKFYSKYVTASNYCARSNEGAVCNRDSGGGMMFKIGDTWYLGGLMSHLRFKRGEDICDPSQYTVFTNITKFLPWIKKNVYDL